MNHVSPMTDAVEDENERSLLLEMATALVAQLQAGQTNEANQTIYELCKLRETSLFQEIGKLTRDLHNTLNSFSEDKNFEKFTKESLPDAKKRLDYVVQVTEESAHKTITVVEDSLETINDIAKRSLALRKQSDATNADVLNEYLAQTIGDAKKMNASLIDVLMAQSYQDVTGQVIQRVITLVQDIEVSLVSMIKTCGISSEYNAKNGAAVSVKQGRENDSHGFGPVVPGVKHDAGNSAKSVSNEVVQSQDEVDDLLSTLGF